MPTSPNPKHRKQSARTALDLLREWWAQLGPLLKGRRLQPVRIPVRVRREK